MTTTTSTFDAMRARAEMSRRASTCSAWRRESSRPTFVSATGIAVVHQSIVPAAMGNLGYPTTDAKHIGRRPGAASP